MTNNLTALYDSIIQEINSQDIILKKIDDSNFSTEKNELNNILNTIFIISSSNEYSFSIDRKNYNSCEIILFDNNNTKNKKFTIIYKKQEKSFIYNLRYNILKSIRIIPIIGPDGVGKTTLFHQIEKSIKDKIVYKRFKKIVRRSVIYNILFPVNKIILKKQIGRKPEKDQHDDKNAKLIILAGIIYYPYLLFMTLFQKRLIFIDRFFHDYLLEDISFMEKPTHLRKNWKIFLKFIPLTFWHIQLDAKSEIILSRKDELSLDDINKYRELNFKLYLEKPSPLYSYINTGNDIENCKNILLYTGSDIIKLF